MKYQIKDDLYLEGDEKQFYLRETTDKEDKDGNPIVKTHGYYGRPEDAVRNASRILMARQGDLETLGTLADLKKDIQEVYTFIRKQFEVINS